MKIEYLLRHNASDVFGYFERPKFHEERSVKNPQLRWEELCCKFHPFARTTLGVQSPNPLEVLFTGKDVGWVTRDANIWVGSEQRPIREISDLSSEEGGAFLGIGLELCRKLSRESGMNHAFAIGFNPEDIGRPGHHNVNWLHAHLHACDDPKDLETLQRRAWKDMHWFDRLTFVEPFTQLFFDHLQYIGNDPSCGVSQAFHVERAVMSDGKIVIPIDTQNPEVLFRELKFAYEAMKVKYAEVERIFTERSVDPLTGRYIPYPIQERLEKLYVFLQNNTIFSEKSRALLFYLAQHAVCAEQRPSSRENFIQRANHVHFTKGFAGAINLVYDFASDDFRFEFLPRILTSSAVAKTMFGENGATIMGAHKPATHKQIDERDEYLNDITRHLVTMGFIPPCDPIHYLSLEDGS